MSLDALTDLIPDTSPEGLALVLSRWGMVGTVHFDTSATSRISLEHQGRSWTIVMIESSDSKHRSILFRAAFAANLQHWEAQLWAEKHMFGRLFREDSGEAMIDFAVPFDGVTFQFLKTCLEIWTHIMDQFDEFCRSRAPR